MIRLYLMRHGIAIDREDPDCPPEAERYLTPKGVAKTRAAAQGLRALGVKPDTVITSPYLRAVQTAEIACEALRFRPAKLRRSDALLPEADPAQILRELARIRPREVLCVGHAPNLDLVIAHALGSERTVTTLKKAGVACLDLTSTHRGTLLWIYPPRALRTLAH
jgi:phosphohistidine phosphatase